MSEPNYSLGFYTSDGMEIAYLEDQSVGFYAMGLRTEGSERTAIESLADELATRITYRASGIPDVRRIPQELHTSLKAALAQQDAKLAAYTHNIIAALSALPEEPTPTPRKTP